MKERKSATQVSRFRVRRRVLGLWLVAFAGALALGLLGGVVAFLLPPRGRGWRRQKTRVGDLASLPEGNGKLVLVDGLPVWVINTRHGLRAVSALCTHQGCMVRWEGKRKLLVCPCHAGAFDASGNVVEGLPTEPLQRYVASAIDGVIFVGGETASGSF